MYTNTGKGDFLHLRNTCREACFMHTADGAVAAYHRMGVNRVAIKAQVLTGGRGKAGGVKLANNDRDVYQYAQTILEMTIKGYPVTKILLSEAVNIAAEYYISFTIDRNTRSVTLIMSAAGGMDHRGSSPPISGKDNTLQH